MNQCVLKTQRLDNFCHIKDYSHKITYNDLKTNQRCLLQNNEYSACSIPLRAIIAAILLAKQYDVFHRHVQRHRTDPSVSITSFHFLWERTRTVKDNQERANQYTDIIQWHTNPMARKRKDIRDRTVPWMHLMYCIPSTLMQSIVILPSVEKVALHRHFMTFNPYSASREYYLTSLRIGHFWSQMIVVSEYVEIIRLIEQSAQQCSTQYCWP